MFFIVSEIKLHIRNEQEHNLCEHFVGIFSPYLLQIWHVYYMYQVFAEILI